MFFGTTERELDAWYVTQGIKVGNFYIAYVYIFAFIMAVALIAVLFVLLYRTKFGRSVRALMQNRTAAQLIGINVERVSAHHLRNRCGAHRGGRHGVWRDDAVQQQQLV